MTTDHHNPDLPATALAVLGLLSFGPMSGYDLKQAADRSIRHFYWSPAKSQIYAELRRLRGAGLVTEEHVEQETRPDKRVYAITDEGRLKLRAWLNSDNYEPDMHKSTTLLKLFFGNNADLAALIRTLEQDLESKQKMLTELREAEAACKATDPVFTLLTIRAGLAYAGASISWAEETIATLRGLEMTHPGTRKGRNER